MRTSEGKLSTLTLAPQCTARFARRLVDQPIQGTHVVDPDHLMAHSHIETYRTACQNIFGQRVVGRSDNAHIVILEHFGIEGRIIVIVGKDRQVDLGILERRQGRPPRHFTDIEVHARMLPCIARQQFGQAPGQGRTRRRNPQLPGIAGGKTVHGRMQIADLAKNPPAAFRIAHSR